MNIDLLNRYFGAALYHQVHTSDPTTGAARSRERSPARGEKPPRATVQQPGGAAI